MVTFTLMPSICANAEGVVGMFSSCSNGSYRGFLEIK